MSLAVAIVLAAVLTAQQLPTSQAAYAGGIDRTSETQESANAAWSKIISQNDVSTTVLSTSISISKIGDQTFIILHSDIVHPEVGEADRRIGQLLTTDDAFTMNNNLGSATLSPVRIDLCPNDEQNEDGTCDVTPTTVTVQAEWTGIGHVSKDRTSESSDTPKIVVRTSDRDATATATIDGEDPGDLISASLSKIVTVTST